MADAVPGTRIQQAGRPLDGLPKAAPQGRAERERASSTADPQCISDTRGREHRSDAAMRDFSLFQDTL